MKEHVDSIIGGNDILTPISKIAENTEPINLVNWDLAWWSFSIAMLSLIAGIIAAIYSYRGYKFQRISAERLENLIPGQINYYEVVCCLVKNIIDFESIYFGERSFRQYPAKLILSISKLPDDLIVLDKYEKNKRCFEDALKLKIAWRNYNTLIDNLINDTEHYTDEEIASFVNYLISLSKSYIILIQKFESTLVENSFLEENISTNNRIAFFILDRFFECLEAIDNLDINILDTKRLNIKKQDCESYTFAPYLPNLIAYGDYLKSEHSFRLKSLASNQNHSDDSDFISAMLNNIKSGKYNRLDKSLVFPPNVEFSSLDICHFKNAYYNFIEPILVGFKRYEYYTFLKSN